MDLRLTKHKFYWVILPAFILALLFAFIVLLFSRTEGLYLFYVLIIFIIAVVPNYIRKSL